MTITNQPPPGNRRGRGTTPPPPNRLPSTRERRPALAALAVLLIAGGAVLAGWFALRQSHTESYLVVNRTVHWGEKIDSSDVRKIDLPADSGGLIPASQAGEVIDSYAQVELLSGTVLADGMYGDAPDLDADEDLLGVELQPSQFPRALKPGDSVVIVLSNPEETQPILLSDGVVRGIQGAETGGGSTVDLVMSNRCSDQMSVGASAGNVQVVKVSPNARPLTCADPAKADKPPKGKP